MSPHNVQSLYADAAQHYQKGRLNEARVACRQLLDREPRHPGCTSMLAVIAWQQGRLEEALAGFDAALRIARSAENHFHRGSVLKALGRHEEALADFDAALNLNPAFAEAHLNKGAAMLDMGQPQEALRYFEAALKVQPGYVAALNNKGNALLALGRAAESLPCYDDALAAQPNLAQAHHNRANALQALNRLEEAIAGYDRATTIRPGYAGALCHKGNALQKLSAFVDAVTCYDLAVAIDPDHVEAWSNRARALSNLGRDAEAVDDYRRLVRLSPDDSQARHHLGMALLRMGNLREGWPLFEARKAVAPAGQYRDDPRLWLGHTSIDGKVLLVDAEQGLGDTLQFSRHLHRLEQMGAHVVLSVQDSLVRLLDTAFPKVHVVPASKAPPAFDLHVPLLSLPLALRLFDSDALSDGAYLAAEPARTAKWRQRLAGPGFRVGICWQGNAKSAADVGRSFGVEQFAGLAELAGVRLISLQKGTSELPFGIEDLGTDFDAGPNSFLDTAAVMESIELIITSDTAVAHLAGALGRPVWVALRHWPDWRWFTHRSDSPWYPTMTLFRQRVPDDWAQVFADIQNSLLAKLGRNA
jgi:tetratricopeptide (TPR) repeat protein